MKFLHAFLVALAILFPGPGRGDEQKEKLHRPRTIVEIYDFAVFAETPQKAERFTFHRSLAGYSLTWNQDSKDVCRDVLYVKTFGGRGPTVTIHLIDKRFVVYPETVKDSEIPGATFSAMKAVTKIRDTRTGKVFQAGKPYEYDHDIPLHYDLDDPLLDIWMEEQNAAARLLSNGAGNSSKPAK